jgi:heme exporter protein B
MQLLRETGILIQKEVLLELRQRYALNGMLLYVVSTVVVCYFGFGQNSGALAQEPWAWNTLFWIILLFTAINAIAKSFAQERQGRLVYYYTLASPQSIIVSKIIYNSLLMLLLALTGYAIYSLVLGNPVEDNLLFLINVGLGAVGFSSTLTMVSGIAAKAGNNSVLMAILSFPVIIPLLILLIRVSKNAMDGLDWSASGDEVITLLAINAIVLSVSYILFPYLWRS